MSNGLYDLLPTAYKLRDDAGGEPLRVLLSIIQGSLDRVEGDIAQLYDNWFIETCDEWVVPYIGDLLGVRGQYAYDEKTISVRPLVANTLGYRRRKGTVSVLERLAQDATGWPGRAVEMFPLLATTQHLNHIRKIDVRTPDLRDTNALELLDGPFERAMHFAEVRRMPGGRYNIPNVAVFLWRLLALGVDRAPAIPITTAGPGRYTFSQLGRDMPLFNPPRIDLEARRIVESDVPGPLRSRAMYDESEAARAALVAGRNVEWTYFAAARPSVRVFDDGVEILPELIQVCDLSEWATLPPAKTFVVPDPPHPPKTLTTRVAIDPRLGRVAIVSGTAPKALLVSYSYGFSAQLGGGDYPRPDPAPVPGVTPYSVVAADRSQLVDVALKTTLGVWDGAHPARAAIAIRDNAIYEVPDIIVPADHRLTIRAASEFRPMLRLPPIWNVTLGPNAALELDGLLVSGGTLRVTTQDPAGDAASHELSLRDCTLVPGLTLDETGAPLAPSSASIEVATGSAGPLTLSITRSITGRLDLRATPTTLTLADAIVDGCGTTEPAVWGAAGAMIDRTTILGGTTASTLEASNTIFDAPALIERTQVGCVRFSFVPEHSQVPKRFMCQTNPLLPTYTSRRYGDPGYVQLATLCPDEIKTGADDGAEIGAFQMLQQPQRLSNLRIALDEYLRFGLDAGTFLVT